MPITTSVITGTVAHKHSATGGSGDGGKLATGGLGGDTSFDLASGSLMYSNGTSLDELVIGGTGTVLTESGGVPTWAIAGGAKTNLISHTVLTSNVNEISSSFSAIPQTDVSKFFGTFATKKSVANSSVQVQVNGLTSNYDQWIIKQKQVSTMGNWTQTGAAHWEAFTNLEGDIITMDWNLVFNPVEDTIQFSCNGRSETSQFYQTGYNTTASQTSFDELRFFTNAGTFGADTFLSIYRLDI